MKIKKMFASFVPSFRARNAIIAELAHTNKKIDKIEKRIDQLDNKNEFFLVM